MEREGGGEVLRAVLLLNSTSATEAAVARTLDDHCIEYRMVGRWTEVLEEVVEEVVQFVVLDLDMVGVPGVRLIGMVQAAAPDATIVVISELEVIELAALEAGTSLMLRPSDLRPLQELVRHSAVPASDS